MGAIEANLVGVGPFDVAGDKPDCADLSAIILDVSFGHLCASKRLLQPTRNGDFEFVVDIQVQVD